MAIKAEGKKSLFQTIKQKYKDKMEEQKGKDIETNPFKFKYNQPFKKPVYEKETVDNMKQVLTGKITGNKATEIRKMFMDEFGAEALTILKKELKMK